MAIPKAIAFLLIAMGSTGLSAQVETPTSPDQPPYSLAIRATQPEAKLGKPIVVDITLTNITSDKTPGIPIDRGGHIGLTYDLYVTDSQGAEPQSTPYLRALRGKRKSDDPYISLDYEMKVWIVQPGKSLTTHMDITRLYNIEVPGTYTVWAERLDKSSGIRVKSNAAYITVTP